MQQGLEIKLLSLFFLVDLIRSRVVTFSVLSHPYWLENYNTIENKNITNLLCAANGHLWTSAMTIPWNHTSHLIRIYCPIDETRRISASKTWSRNPRMNYFSSPKCRPPLSLCPLYVVLKTSMTQLRFLEFPAEDRFFFFFCRLHVWGALGFQCCNFHSNPKTISL